MSDKYDIIVLAGQSNAEGYGLGDVTHQYKKNSNIYILVDKNRESIYFDDKGILRCEKEFEPKIIEAEERINEEGNPVGNFSLSFAEEYYKKGMLKEDRKLLIIYSAVGGTGFSKHQWGNTAVLQDRMFKMIDYAISLNSENKIVAFLWHQGEHDAFESVELNNKTREAFYYEKFNFLLKEVKNKYGNDIIPLAAGFCSEWVNTGYSLQSKAINCATKRVLKENGGAFIKTEDLLSNNEQIQNGDNIHFSRQSLYILGKRYFKKYMKIVTKNKS